LVARDFFIFLFYIFVFEIYKKYTPRWYIFVNFEKENIFFVKNKNEKYKNSMRALVAH